jgi:hypothetical protein
VKVLLACLVVAAVAASTAASSTSLVSTRIVGRWSRKIAASDWRRYHVSLPAGTWRLVVKPSGIVEVVAPREKATSFYSRFKTPSRSRLNIGVIPFCTAASDSYKWTRRTGRMIVRRISDNCGARTALFAGTWRRT